MSDYLKSTNFATKDSLPSGNAGKIVKGTEIDNEFNAIADAIESKADLLNPTFSGLLTTDTLTTGGATNIGGTLAVAGTLSAAADVQFTGTGRMLFPKGTTAQRPASPTAGSVRYNTDLNYLENFNGTVWKPVGFITPADVSDQTNTSTGYFQVPVGNTTQRPASPAEGIVRYNSEIDIYEGYINGAWHKFLTANQNVFTMDYVLVAGGGAGGTGGSTMLSAGGGGGGGTVRSSVLGQFSMTPGTTYNIIVGAGGASGSTSGSNTTAFGFTAVGGGRGGTYGSRSGLDGGSGGGAGSGSGAVGGAGTSGQGFAGAGPVGSGSGGGGGATAAASGSNGGAGVSSSLTGSTIYYSGGGGGGSYDGNSGGIAGVGGAGTGGDSQFVTRNGGNGTANTGGGGGGGSTLQNTNGDSGVGSGGNGGSGVVVLSIPTTRYTGTHTGSPLVSTLGSNTLLTFQSSGSYTA